MKPLRPLLTLLLMTSPLVASPALSQPTTQAVEEDKYTAALSLFKAGRFEASAIQFQQLWRENKAPIALYNLARSLQELGRSWEAAEVLDAYLEVTEQERISETKAWRRESTRSPLYQTRREISQRLPRSQSDARWLEEARAALAEITRADIGAKDTLSHILLSRVLRAQGMIQEALEVNARAEALAILEAHQAKIQRDREEIRARYGQLIVLNGGPSAQLLYLGEGALDAPDQALLERVEARLRRNTSVKAWLPRGPYQVQDKRVEVDGQARTITLEDLAAPRVEGPTAPWYKRARTLGYVGIGAGLLTLGAGAWLQIEAHRHHDEAIERWRAYDARWTTSRDDAINYQNAATGTLTAGALLLLVGSASTIISF